MEAISFVNITKKYKDFKLDNITFSLDEGRIMGLIGPNGAGKTTIIKMLMGLNFQDSGVIKVFDKEIRANEIFIKKRIGYIPDENILPDYITPKTGEKMMKSFYNTWDNSIYKALIEKYELPNEKSVKNYSRGMKVKLMIALTLAHCPGLVIMDESTSGLDPLVRREVLDDIFSFSRNSGVSFLLSSHITSDIEHIADDITVLKSGRMICSSSKNDIMSLEKYKKAPFDDIVIDLLKEG